MKPLKTSATYDDLCDVPELFIAEIVDGDLYASRRPPVRHIYAASVLGAYLGAQFDRCSSGPDGWIMLNKPELHFGGDVLVPDITGWRRSRLPELPNAAFMTVAADWVCEVRWPTTETLDRSNCSSMRVKASRMPGLWTRSGIRSRCCRSTREDGCR